MAEFVNTEDLTAAEGRCRGAVHDAPDSAAAHAALAEVLLRLGRADEAEASCRTSIQLDPDAAEHHCRLGRIYAQRGSLPAAAASFQAALNKHPEHAPAAYWLGCIADHQGDVDRSAALFARALQVNPGFVQARIDFMEMLIKRRRFDEAIALGRDGVEWIDGHAEETTGDYRKLLTYLADTYKLNGGMAGARACYQKILARHPGDTATLHLLAAAEGRLTYDYARAYALDEFDRFAATFDERLVGELGYCAPETIAAGLWQLRPRADAFARLLDLGCGTGLAAAALSTRYRFEQAVGVDVAANMLIEAGNRGRYAELIKGDIAEVMAGRAGPFDLIVAADVFIYVGDLAAVFAQAARLLRPGGIFAFSIESSEQDDVELSGSGRYRQSQGYIYRLAFDRELDLLRIAPGPIRRDQGKYIEGLYIYLTTSAQQR